MHLPEYAHFGGVCPGPGQTRIAILPPPAALAEDNIEDLDWRACGPY